MSFPRGRTSRSRLAVRGLVAGCIVWSLCFTGEALAQARSQRPNVILILTDDQGYGDLGCHGNPVLKTPNLDRLFRQSARLKNFHVDPTCSPTRSALLTGRY